MIDENNIPDQTNTGEHSDLEKETIKDAQRVGNSPNRINTSSAQDDGGGGALQQTVNPEAIEAGLTGAAGGETDVSGGVANLDETAGDIVDQNDYNR